ncbi:MAG: energy transducer TonB [Blastocatellia bacterium]|nr:energy transducer TonB [Blastocatellia bacterium]
MFENLFESASPKAVKLRHLKFVGVVSTLWVVTFFTTLVEEIVLAPAELEPLLEMVVGCLYSPKPRVLPLPMSPFTICRRGSYTPEISRFPDIRNRKNSIWLERHAIKKVYPNTLNMCLTSTFVVDIVISEQGKVISAKFVRGWSPLAECSIQAALQWRFKPLVVNGKPVQIAGQLKFRYENGCLVK